jgi:hypothetical protein
MNAYISMITNNVDTYLQHIFNIFFDVCKLVNKVEMMISSKSLNMDHLGLKLGYTALKLENLVYTLGASVPAKNILEIGQNGCYDDFQVKFEYGSLVFRNYVTQPFNRKNLSTLRGYCMIQIT